MILGTEKKLNSVNLKFEWLSFTGDWFINLIFSGPLLFGENQTFKNLE
jgi:hypothetical protein